MATNDEAHACQLGLISGDSHLVSCDQTTIFHSDSSKSQYTDSPVVWINIRQQHVDSYAQSTISCVCVQPKHRNRAEETVGKWQGREKAHKGQQSHLLKAKYPSIHICENWKASNAVWHYMYCRLVAVVILDSALTVRPLSHWNVSLESRFQKKTFQCERGPKIYHTACHGIFTENVDTHKPAMPAQAYCQYHLAHCNAVL